MKLILEPPFGEKVGNNKWSNNEPNSFLFYLGLMRNPVPIYYYKES